MKPIKTALLALPLLAAGCNRDSGTAKIRPLEAGSVRVEDAFWSPRYEKWEHVTVGDMLDKFEGNDPAHFACGIDAFENFDLVASGAAISAATRGRLGTTGWCTRRSGGSPTCWHNVPTRRSKPV